MPFITQGKTNWKFLLIVIVLAAVVVGFSWWLSKNIFIEGPLIKPTKPDEKYCEKDSDCVFNYTGSETCSSCSSDDYQCVSLEYYNKVLWPEWEKNHKGILCEGCPMVTDKLQCTCEKSLCKKIVKDETADWNTYMDRKYKYEVKYPDDWIYLGGLGASIGSFNVKAPVGVNNQSDTISAGIIPREGFESNQEYIDNAIHESIIPGYKDLLSKKEVTFNNLKGYEIIWKITDYETNKTYEGPINVFFETPSGNKARFIGLNFAGEDSEDNPNLPIFRRVLTTFNFLGTEETSCENWSKECAGEGEDLCSVCGCKNCCSGLVKREIKYPYSDENNEVSCLEEMTAYTCVECGDKICSRGEDWCICPEDCKKPKAWEASFKEMALSMVPQARVCCNAAGSPVIQAVVGAALCNPTTGKNWPTASAVGTITVNTNCQLGGSFSMTITPGTSNSGTCINAICTQETCTFNGC